ncbi:D-alanine--D-alanine ligase [Sporosarcina sp. P12(2017)]|uniref:D-alanine--D-alanine ligase n=1 Tax=unclassified Sporosarcina TaxID=2647733 RepID=UPI000C163B83|nr:MULTISPECIES: D-alanine--D-alanine ligase [unclassified Sporosarcina]PIC58075.1 D-alanine--D-alanine ligase [Sporosarcina sp. P10]PIC61577.1 D-alanine--D-alanine ligase [Sporosarcina sp. P12(2017)]
MKKRLGLVYGGKSAEHEVSLSTARAVTEALDLDKYEVLPIYITMQGEWLKGDPLTGPVSTIEALRLKSEQPKPDHIESFLQGDMPDVILPLLHGTNGEDGTVQGLFEVLNIPYAGNGVLASSAGMDKVVMKQLFAQAGLTQVAYVHFIRSTWKNHAEQLLDQAEQELSYPMFVKPANLGSSVGISKADDRESLEKAVELALKFDRKIIVEQGIVAREIEMAVLGNDHPKVSVAGEIRPVADFYDYEAKYKDQSTELSIPAEMPDAVAEHMKDMAIRAFKVLDCSGLVRADFFVTADDEVWINEVNTLPGFTPSSMFPLLWQKSGLTYPELIDQLIELAVERHTEKQQLQYTMD